MQKYIKKKGLSRLRSFYNIKIGLDLFLYSSFILNEKKTKEETKRKREIQISLSLHYLKFKNVFT